MILSVQKQPGVNTLALTRETDRVLVDLQRTLPAGVVIEKENFRQADFIQVAVRNVSLALRDGAMLVLIVLFLFLEHEDPWLLRHSKSVYARTLSFCLRRPAVVLSDRQRLDQLPVTTPSGRLIRLGDIAPVRFDLGPGLVRRENVQRLAMLTANVAGGDLVAVVETAQAAVREQVALPEGYRVTFGGQFEEGARSVQNLAGLTAVILLAMYGLLLLAFRSHRHTLIVLVNLPLALVGASSPSHCAARG